MRAASFTMKGSDLFRSGLRIYVNRIEEKFDTGLHDHDFVELNYVAEGIGYQHLSDRVRPVSRGDLFAHPVGSFHVYRPYSTDRNRRLVVYNVVFEESVLDEIAAAAPELELGRLWRSLADNPPNAEAGAVRDTRLALEPLFERIYEEHAALRPGAAAMLHALLTQILIGWVRLLRAAEGGDGSPRTAAAEAAGSAGTAGVSDTGGAAGAAGMARPAGMPGAAGLSGAEAIDEAVAFVRERAAEPLTLREAAKRFRLSERHFHRLFKLRTGQTFHEFVQRQRVLAACKLLRSTRQKLEAIAEQVGYRDVQSFCRVFKSIEGRTPGRYRREESGRGSGTS